MTEETINQNINPDDTRQNNVDTSSGPSDNNQPEVVENKTEDIFKTFTTEKEYNDVLKSNRQKAITDLYHDLGITKLDEIKDALLKQKEYAEISEKYSQIQNENQNLKKNALFSKLNIDENSKDNFETLVNARVQKNKSNFEEEAVRVLEEMPQFKKSESKSLINSSIEKEPANTRGTVNYSDEILSECPWLKNFN